MVAGWVGPWPALAIAASVAVIGALMVIGSLRTEPLRYVAGAAVTGFGLAAIASAIRVHAGGQLGDGTGGAIAQAVGGSWAGILLGLLVIAASVWFAFLSGPSPSESDAFEGGAFDDDDFGPVEDEADGFGVGDALAGAVTGAVAGAQSLAGRMRRSPSTRGHDEPAREGSGLGRGGQRGRKIHTKSKRRANPVTLGDALASGASEGVSHDETQALAPDEKALAYMEDVWRKASDAYQQTQPVPPSPYPEDVRLRGEIPDGAAPLSDAGKSDSDAGAGPAAAAAQASAPTSPMPPIAAPAGPAAAPVGGPDIAPFDFHDELSAPMPLVDAPQGQAPMAASLGAGTHGAGTPAPAAGPADPFGAAGPQDLGLSQVESDALESAARSEGAAAAGPAELPDGVKPYVPETPAPAEAPMASSVEEVLAGPEGAARPGEVSAQAMQAGAMPAEFTPPPAPAWETGYAEEEATPDEAFAEPEDIAEVDPTGHWPRREDDVEEASEPVTRRHFELTGGVKPEDAEEVPAVEASMAASEELVSQEVGLAETDVLSDALPTDWNAAISQSERVEPGSAQADLAGDLPLGEEDVAAALREVLEADLVEDADDLLDEEIAEAEFEDDEVEAEVDDAEEPLEEGAEGAIDEELEEEELEEDVEWVDEDGNPIDPEDLGEEYELVDGEEEDAEEDEEAAGLDGDSEEDSEEYEYVDEEGNPIDPEDVDGEWEVVEDEEEELEVAELEDSDEENPGEELPEEEDSEEEAEADSDAGSEAVSEDSSEPVSEEDGEWEEDWEDADDGEAEEAAEADSTPGAEGDSADDGPEATVILEPQAPPEAPEPAPASLTGTDGLDAAEAASGADSGLGLAAGGASGDAQRLLAAGRVVVQEGRVAVSLLQREFSMEFDEACAVLDELQQEGLIGPYKGGKARDILLTAEEWEGRFAHS